MIKVTPSPCKAIAFKGYSQTGKKQTPLSDGTVSRELSPLLNVTEEDIVNVKRNKHNLTISLSGAQGKSVVTMPSHTHITLEHPLIIQGRKAAEAVVVDFHTTGVPVLEQASKVMSHLLGLAQKAR